MNTTDLLVVLDRAHGHNVPGKKSPDGKHEEWLWSDNFVIDLKAELDKFSIKSTINPIKADVPLYTDKKGRLKEHLSIRKNYYNSLPYKYRLVLSFHNDAVGTKGWTTQTGWSMWTTEGDDISDLLAEKYLYPTMKKHFPDLRHRRYFAKQLDNEANFTAITGNYAGILLEWLMQNNKKDIELLKDTTKLRKAIVEFILKVHLHFEELKPNWKF